ncbi:hypothetical protein V6N12_057280 [Hibiscus sabdariffa]|uniref:Uncharacterized protein n=1 Tax=Hibiscus sabdariffa TaxID=183260 RepID=A0ABR2DCA4_9ROSI
MISVLSFFDEFFLLLACMYDGHTMEEQGPSDMRLGSVERLRLQWWRVQGLRQARSEPLDQFGSNDLENS